MAHHFHVDSILDIVTVEDGNLAVHHHILCVERPHRRLMIILHLQPNPGDLFRVRQLDFVSGVRLGRYSLVWLDDLVWIASIVHYWMSRVDRRYSLSLTTTGSLFASMTRLDSSLNASVIVFAAPEASQ